jgi:2-dehydropantoate 2-reductase
MPRYVIVGAGAVGASFAAALSDRADVVVVARGANLEHLRSNPLTFRTSGSTRDIDLKVTGIDELQLRVGDVLLLAVKTQHVEGLAEVLAWKPVHTQSGELVGSAAESLPVVTLQNGLDAERAVARWFAHIIGATVLIAARYTTVGEVRVGGRPRLGGVHLGEPYRSTDVGADAARTLAADLRAVNFEVAETAEITKIKATKILHSVKNGLEVLAGDESTQRRIGRALEAEARLVLDAAGVEYGATRDLALNADQTSFDPEIDVVAGQQSTWQSFARGAGSHEVDHLNGEIALLARLHGVDAPLNTKLQALLGTALERGGGTDLPGLDALVELAAASPSL